MNKMIKKKQKTKKTILSVLVRDLNVFISSDPNEIVVWFNLLYPEKIVEKFPEP